MLVRWKGEDLGEYKGMPRVHEARLIKKWTGLNPPEFLQAVVNFDPDAFAAFVCIMHGRVGKPLRINDVDGEFTDLDMELDDEEKKLQADEQAESIQPVVAQILVDLGVDLDAEYVRDIVMKRLAEAQEKQEQAAGNVPSVAGTVA